MSEKDILVFTNNHGNKINDAINSVIIQKQPCKIYVFNNGKELLINKNLKKKIYQIHEVPHINGPSALRNYGICKSDSKYVFFLDGDDVWSEEKLTLQMEVLKKYPNDVVYSDCSNYYQSSNKKVRLQKKYYFDNQFKNMLLRNMSITGSMSGIGVSREVLKNLKKTYGFIFDENIFYAEDFDLYLRLSKVSKFRKINKDLVTIHISQNSYSHSFSTIPIFILRYKVKLKNIFDKFNNLNSITKFIYFAIVTLELIFYFLNFPRAILRFLFQRR